MNNQCLGKRACIILQMDTEYSIPVDYLHVQETARWIGRKK